MCKLRNFLCHRRFARPAKAGSAQDHLKPGGIRVAREAMAPAKAHILPVKQCQQHYGLVSQL